MSAVEAVEALRARRIERNRKNPGAAMRSGWDAFLSPAEEAAQRLADIERDKALVEAELAKEAEHDAVAEQARKELPGELKKAYSVLFRAQQNVVFAYSGGSIKVEPGAEQVEVVGLAEAMRECVEARKNYDAVWWRCERYSVADERLMPMALGREISELLVLAQAL